MKTRESSIERRWVKELEKRGAKVDKFGQNGNPDRIVFFPGGKTTLIEFKAPGQTLSKLQDYQCGELLKRGHDVAIVKAFSQEDVDKLWRQVCGD